MRAYTKPYANKRDNNRGRFYSLGSQLITILLSGIVLLVALSCATVPKEPLAPGKVRLLSIDVPGSGIKGNSAFAVNIFFEAVGEPEIRKACFYGLGEGLYCLEVTYATFGTKRFLQVQLPGIRPGSYRAECYAEYFRDGEVRKTNVITTQILVGY
jgi:hypothetical protein